MKNSLILENKMTFNMMVEKVKMVNKDLFEKSLIKSREWKKTYKKISKSYKSQNVIPLNTLYYSIPNDRNFLTLILFLYGLEIENPNTYIFNDTMNLKIDIFKDINFREYYFKVVSSLSVLKKEKIQEVFTIFYGTTQRIIISYYLFHEKNFTPLKIRNLLSFLFKDTDIYISHRTSEIDNYLEQIKTGIKEVILKTEVHNTDRDNQSKKINILTTIQNSIRIKYITGKNGKHIEHKSPITHIRKEHTRILKSGKIITVKGSIVNKQIV